MKAKIWLGGWLALSVIALGIMGLGVYKIDPYMHFHKPVTEKYYYLLNNQRSQNNGIIKHFDYDAIITGTSMTENFKTSEFDDIFDVNSIKVPYSGGSYKEINDNLVIALENNPKLKAIVRGLDMGRFFDEASLMRNDLGKYPTYLYDSNPFNDIEYICNRDVIFSRAYAMTIENDTENFNPGITSFDDYSRWQYSYTFGVNTICPEGVSYKGLGKGTHLTDDEKKKIEKNIKKNVTSLADNYPSVDFYYFITPYSILWWETQATNGLLEKQIEAEKYIIELILPHKNIHLYSFNNRTDITTDLNNYKDDIHYGQWINSLMIRWMHDEKYLLTEDNYKQYINEELSFYSSYDYNKINGQNDYESDFYIAALLNNELTGAEPIKLLDAYQSSIELSEAELIEVDNAKGIECIGSLERASGDNKGIDDYLISNDDYVGAKFSIDDIGDHNYLVFYGKMIRAQGQPSVYVYNNENEVVGAATASYDDLDNEWHQYVIDLSSVEGSITIIFNGGYIDKSGNEKSTYLFKDITLY